LTTRYIDSDPHEMFRKGAPDPRNYTRDAPVPVPPQPPRVVSGILTRCRQVGQEYASLKVFVRNPQQIYLLNTNAKKYMDEILGLLFAKFDGNVAEMSRVSEKLPAAHKTLSTSFRGRAAGMAVKGTLPSGLDYGPPQIVSLAISYANKEGSNYDGDVSDMRGVV